MDSAKLYLFVHQYSFTDTSRVLLKLLGYTDTMGTEAYNMALSSRRCDAVNNILRRMLPTGEGVNVLKRPMGERGSGKQSEILDRRLMIVLCCQRCYAEDTGRLSHQQNPATKANADKVVQTRPHVNEVADTVIILDNIYFEPDRPVLTMSSIDVLPRYINLLKKYKNSYIEVGGHVNHTDSKLAAGDPLFKLSEQRAKVIYEYLIDSGFDTTKVTHKGYGNAHLLFAMPANIQEKEKNMRVEIIVFKSL